MSDFDTVHGIPAFSLGKFTFLVNTPVLVIILVLFFIFYCIVSGVLVYHWKAYGMGKKGILVAEALYLMVSAALFVLAILGIHYF